MGPTHRHLGLAVLCALAASLSAVAHETDQFTVPVGKEFADLGEYFTALAYDTIASGVTKTNANIRQARQGNHNEAYIARMESPDELASNVFAEFTPAFFLIENLENMVHSRSTKKKYPGRVVGYRETIQNIYQHVHFPLDPRQFFRLWHASTMQVYGTYLGPDKIGHFTDMGYQYYGAYRRALRQGLSEEAAVKKAVMVGTDGLLFAETGMVGFLSAGAYSNADLAANYVGFKFYKNLTQETRIQGELRPPMVRREGHYWRISPHVRRDSDFFSLFISDHYNEALNPSLFEEGMRKPVRQAVAKRAANLLRWYADDNGNRRPKAYFDALGEELRTYYGEDYGHRGSYDELITIGNTCFDGPPSVDQPGARNANGYTSLHWAALVGDTALAQQALRAGAAVDERVQSLEAYSAEWGSTAVHLAAASGRSEMVQLLLDTGADVNARNERRATPLHRAIDHPEIVEALIARGADVNAQDERGRTPLHWLARYPTAKTVGILIANGAQVDVQDHAGETALHRAALWGHTDMMESLLLGGADVNARADFQSTPLHFAAGQPNPAAVDVLIRHGADLQAQDEFGWTALHEVANRGYDRIGRVLLAAGADARVVDQYGSTPLHEAARRGHDLLVALLLTTDADVNAPNSAGSVPLHEAVFGGHASLVNVLLAHGADASVQNHKGQSALDLASSRGHQRAAVLLLGSSRRASSPMDHRLIPGQ